MIGREDEVRSYRDRIWVFQLAVGLGFAALLCRLVYLQVIKGEELSKFSEANRLKKEKVIAARGIVYDRNGKVIVDNRAAFDVVLLSQYYKFDTENDVRLAKALQISVEDLEKRLAKVDRTPSYYPILLKADVNKDVIAAIETDRVGFSGVDIEASVQRRYVFGDLAAQVLGYISEVNEKDIKADPKRLLQPGDYMGRMGLERMLDEQLRGDDGIGYVEVDAMGRRRKTEGAEKLLGFVAQTDPVQGNNVYLTLDADLTLAANESMKKRGFNGSVVALNPNTGEVLALVNRPAYNPETISGREIDNRLWADLATNKERPMRNRAIQDIYPPGSTFKAIMAIAGVSEGVIKPGTSHYCSGSMQFGNRRPSCWKTHGPTSLVKAIRESCNVFFYNVGIELGVDRIAKYARMFGLGEPTGIVTRGEQRGLIPDSDWKQKTFKEPWQPGETLSVSVGQGYVNVTPIQLVSAYSAIGNGGALYRPYLVRRIETRSGELIQEFRPQLKSKIPVSKEILEQVKQGLFEVANQPGGTAIISGHSKLTTISGKTGTAQVRGFSDIMSHKCEGMPINDRHHGWFVGYAPRENPEIAVVALAEHQCHGASAAPVVRDVVEAFITKQNQDRGVVEDDKKPVVVTGHQEDE